MAEQIKTFLDGFLASQEAVRLATAWIERVTDAAHPGRTAYRITGRSRGAVQAAITARMREAEDGPHGGYGQFLTPWLNRDGLYESRGEVELYAGETAA